MKKTVWLLALSVLVIVVGAVAIWGLQTHSSKSTTEVTSVKDKKQSKKTRSAKEPTKKTSSRSSVAVKSDSVVSTSNKSTTAASRSITNSTPDSASSITHQANQLMTSASSNSSSVNSRTAVSSSTQPQGAWVKAFEQKLYAGYHATPNRYQYIGNGLWEVWVKEYNTGNLPYVTVNQYTGNFHG